MKKNFILLSMAIGVLAVGSLSSCKDTNEDLENDIRAALVNQDATLREALTTQRNELQDQIDALKGQLEQLSDCDCATKLAALQNDLRTLQNELNQLNAALAALGDKADQSAIDALKAEYDQKINELKALIAALEGKIPQGGTTCDCGPKWEALYASLEKVNEAIDKKVDAATFQQFKESVTTATGTVTQTVTDLTERVVALEAARTQMEAAIAKLEKTVAGIDDAMAQINKDGEKFANVGALLLYLYDNLTQATSDIAALKVLVDNIPGVEPGTTEKLSEILTKLERLQALQDTRYDELLKKINDNTSAIASVRNMYKELQKQLNDHINNHPGGGSADLSKLESDIDALQDKIAELEKNKADKSEIDALKEEYDQKIEELKNLIDKIPTGGTTCSCGFDPEKYASIILLQDKIDNLKTELVNEITNQVSKLEADTNTKLSEMEKQWKDADAALKETVEKIDGRVSAVEGEITEIKSQMEIFQKELEKIQNQLASQITSIVSQSIFNPIFGSISLPIGVSSQVLTSYYGEIEGETYFPSQDGEGAYVGDKSLDFTEAELADLVLPEGYDDHLIPGAKTGNGGYAGTIYATINPSSVNLSGTKLKLVDSQNRESGITLEPMQYSDELLSFGGSRNASNGLYEMKATLDASKAGANSLNITMADLKDLAVSVKKYIKERKGLSNVVTNVFKDLAEVVSVPSYGLQASYKTADNKIANVTSGYDIAAISLKPLSYNTLAGKKFHFEKHLADYLKIEEIGNLVKADISFKLGEVDLVSNWKKIDININEMDYDDVGTITLSVSYQYPDMNKATVTEDKKINFDYSPENMITETASVTIDGNSGEFNHLIDKINEKIIENMNKELQNLDKQITANVTTMQGEINELFGDIEADLNTQIQEAINDINEQISGKANSYIRKYNNFVSRISKLFDRVVNKVSEPNLLLQPTMVVLNANKNFQIVSQNKKNPEILKAKGTGDMNVVLYPTSYSGEVLCPAYKKFVKVVSVTGGTAAQNKAAMDKANAALNMNKVIPGNYRAIEFRTNSEYKGLTYEIAYAALDYSGYHTTKRFYIKVK